MPTSTFRTIIPRSYVNLAALLAVLSAAQDPANGVDNEEVLQLADEVPFGATGDAITAKVNERAAALAVAEGCTTALESLRETATAQLREARNRAVALRGDNARQALADVGFTVFHTPASNSSGSGSGTGGQSAAA